MTGGFALEAALSLVNNRGFFLSKSVAYTNGIR